MREHKFRGQRKDTKKWICGYYVKYVDEHYIIKDDYYEDKYYNPDGNFIKHEVIPESVGQFTGLEDKEETPIYEKDVVDIEGKEYEIRFKEGCFFFCGEHNINYNFDSHNIRTKPIKIIRNIFENPLKEAKK